MRGSHTNLIPAHWTALGEILQQVEYCRPLHQNATRKYLKKQTSFAYNYVCECVRRLVRVGLLKEHSKALFLTKEGKEALAHIRALKVYEVQLV